MSWRSRITTPVRHWLEDSREVRRGQQERERLGVTFHNFWKLGPTEKTWFYRFLQRPAFQHLSPAPEVSFFSVFGRRSLVNKVSGKKIFFTGENLANYPDYQHHLLGAVDLALGFDQLSAGNYLRFPLWITDIFPPDADLNAIQSRLREVEVASHDLANRKGFATLIARHDGSGLRGTLADITERFGEVHYPGIFRQNIVAGLPSGYQEKLAFLRNYRFNLCPENSDAPGYVTEKLWHALLAGCIPIYWGSGNNPEPDILNPAAILFFAPDDPGALSRRIQQLTQDPGAVKALTKVSPFQPGAAVVISDYFKRLETALIKALG